MTDKSQSQSQQQDEEQEREQEQPEQQPEAQPQRQREQRDQPHTSTRPGIPELTAEWVVRAQLTISRPGESVTREFTTTKPSHPVKVVYRWNSSDGAQDEEKQRTSSRETLVGSGQSTPSKTKDKQKHAESFNSTTSAGGGDSAFSGSNTSRNKAKQQEREEEESPKKQTPQSLYGTRCRSTCNIIVSAVADFLPPGAASNNIPEETDPFVFNTTASYTVQPEKQPANGASPTASKSFTSGKILALRDAFSQTSDTESKFLGPREYSRSPPYDRRSSTDDYRRQQRRSYDHYRRATDTLLPPPSSPVQASAASASAAAYADEGNSFTPSYTPSPTHTCKSASLPRIPPLPGHQRHLIQQQHQLPASGPRSETKKPRTVHIDVYCTGSDDEDDELDIDESTSSSDANRQEIESNSTPQTVLDNDQMLLRHQRVAGNVLPRRVQLQRDRFSSRSPVAQTSSRSDLNVGHAITKSSTAEEVTESKQLLFRKHIGDQRAAKLQNLRNKYMRKDPSEDALSSNYPNSSRSTVRDTTYSSISSAVASQDQESSWKETEEIEVSVSLAKSDSFDYENSVDRLRIRQMESLWSRSSDDASYPIPHGYAQPAPLQPISENANNSQRSSPYHAGAMQFQRNDTFPSESENFSESDNVFYPYHRYSAPVHHSYYPPHPSHPPHPPPSPSSPSHPPKIVYSYPATPTNDPPAFMQFFGPKHGQIGKPPSPQSQQYAPAFRPGLQRWKSEAREHLPDDMSTLKLPESPRRSGSEGPSSPTQPSSPVPSSSPARSPVRSPIRSPVRSPVRSPTRSPIHSQIPSAAPSPSPQPEHSKRESSETSSKVSVIQGYTHEYLQKARKFGSVVGAVRKPGHHVGPTKNPNCFCEHCQRWKTERFQIRNRAFSLGDKPIVLKRPNFKGN